MKTFIVELIMFLCYMPFTIPYGIAWGSLYEQYAGTWWQLVIALGGLVLAGSLIYGYITVMTKIIERP